MRVFGSSQPSFRKAACENGYRRVRIPVTLKPTRRAGMFSDSMGFAVSTPQDAHSFVSLGFDLLDVTTGEVSFVFERLGELPPRRILLVLSVLLC